MLGDFGGLVVGDGGGEDRDVRFLDPILDGLIHLLRGLDGNEVDSVGDVDDGGSGNENHAMAALLGGFGEGVTHFSRGAIGEVANGIDGLAGGACGDEDGHGFVLTAFDDSEDFFDGSESAHALDIHRQGRLRQGR